jgi:hypothetical protein
MGCDNKVMEQKPIAKKTEQSENVIGDDINNG